MTWTAVGALARRRVIAILPTGAVEAHGPHLPLGTDIIIAEAMARNGAERLSARGFDALVLPALPFAPAPFAAAFPGTIDLTPETIHATVSRIAASLAAHGVLITVIANAHHDPAQVHALRAAAAETGNGGKVIFPDLTRRRWADQLTAEFRSGACHAGRYESSIVLAERPDEVDVPRMSSLAANQHSLVDAIKVGTMSFREAGGPEAYFGSPADASAEEGRQIIEVLGAIVEEAVLEAMSQ
jgi:creatinine amidohydrolase